MYSSVHKCYIIAAVSLSEPLIILLSVSKYVLLHFIEMYYIYIPFCLLSTTLPPRRGFSEAGCLAASYPCFSLRVCFPQGTEGCLVYKYLLRLFLFERPVLLGLNHWWIGNLSCLATVNNHQVLPSPAGVREHQLHDRPMLRKEGICHRFYICRAQLAAFLEPWLPH